MPDANVVFDDADAYERYMGRWSRAVGEKFLAWLAPPKNAQWLDVGCGTGAFSQLILDTASPSAVTGVDPSPAQIEYARKQFPKAQFEVADALALPFGDGQFDIVASALVLHFLPDRAKAFSEMGRVAKPGGIVSGYTWNRTAAETFAPYAPMARGIKAVGITPSLSPLIPEAAPEGLENTLKSTGFRDITISLIDVTRGFTDFDQFWQIQTLTFHPVGKTIAKMSEVERERLRATMRDMLPPDGQGRISYSARAIAFKARAP